MAKILLKNALIIDGSGKKAYHGDVALDDEKISAIGDLKGLKAEKEIDLKGLVLAPGFIDTKSRVDFDWSFLNYPEMKNLVSQGITTALVGNFGFSLFPVWGDNLTLELEKWAPVTNMTINWSSEEELFEILERRGIGINLGTFLGYRVLRRGVIGEIGRRLKKDEIKIIKKFIREALKKGAFGVSVEFSRIPNNPESDEELLEIFKALKGKKSVLSLNFAYGEKESPRELLQDLVKMASETKVSIDIAEFSYKEESAAEVLKLVQNAKKSGLDISLSITPYQEDIVSLSSYLPSWLHEGGIIKMLERLKEKEVRKFLLKGLKKREKEFLNLRIAQSPLNPKFVGASFKEIAEKQEVSGSEALINTLLATGGRALSFRYLKEVIKQADLETIIKNPSGIITAEAGGHKNLEPVKGTLPHPRDFGAFPYFIRHFVLDKKILSLEKAIHKITGMPAKKFGISDRGVIKKGNFGDIVIFDSKEIQSNSDFKNPYAFSSGIKIVFVNGNVVYKEGKFTSSLEGKVLRNES